MHFYVSPRPEGPQSLHFYESGGLTGQNRPQGGLRITAFLRVPAPGGGAETCIFTYPDAGRRRNPSSGATPGAVAPRPGSDARGPVKVQGKRPSRGRKSTGRVPQPPPRVNILNHTILYDPSLILYIPTNPHASSPSPGAADLGGLGGGWGLGWALS